MVKLFKTIGVFLILAGVVFLIRFGLGGSEDTWICQNGEWIKHGNPKEAMPLVPCAKDGQTAEEITSPENTKMVFFEESQIIAEGFAKNSSTYKFDGMALELESSETLKCPSCWDFIFSFQSRQAGYGDRKGQFLAQVITPHTLRVTVEKGEVIAAVVDGTYNELNNNFIK